MHPISGAQDCSGHSAFPFHLFDAFLERRVLAAQVVDAPLQLPQLRLASGADRFADGHPVAGAVHWSTAWSCSTDGVPPALRLLDIVKLSVEVR